jgi:hypothetical protein
MVRVQNKGITGLLIIRIPLWAFFNVNLTFNLFSAEKLILRGAYKIIDSGRIFLYQENNQLHYCGICGYLQLRETYGGFMTYMALLIGFVAGVFSGLVGIGGGIIMIPALVMFMGYNQYMAQGTTLAAMEYYRKGYVNITVALLLAAGFVIGGYLGARFAININEAILKKIFGFTMLFFAVKMILGK